MYFNVFQCISMYSKVFQCISMYTIDHNETKPSQILVKHISLVKQSLVINEIDLLPGSMFLSCQRILGCFPTDSVYCYHIMSAPPAVWPLHGNRTGERGKTMLPWGETEFWSSGRVEWSSGPGAPPRPDEVGGATWPRNEYSDKFETETDEAMSRIFPPGRHPKNLC